MAMCLYSVESFEFDTKSDARPSLKICVIEDWHLLFRRDECKEVYCLPLFSCLTLKKL